MKRLIQKKLAELSEKHDIRILYACESGSRAWGFPSPDSDYDVRFIYVHQPDWYLSLAEGKNTINLPIDEHELDITGWELKKALKLIQKSNASPLEWIQSPIVYQQNETFTASLSELCKAFFSPIAVAYHYHSMAKKYTESLMGQESVKLKSYFYALRTTLSVRWIIEYNTMPPIVFEEMLGLTDSTVRQQVLEMMEVKKTQNETYMHTSEELVNRFLINSLEADKDTVSLLKAANGNASLLDEFFLTTVKSFA